MNYSPRKVLTLSFLLAFCSLSYELIFAQVLSVCLGGTKFKYLITISIFTCALGFGSITYGHLKSKFRIQKIIILVEILLTILGLIGPFLLTWLLKINSFSGSIENLFHFLSYFLIFIVGFLSGFELPCLFSLYEKNHGKTLAFDYLGMLFASLFFPLVGLPVLGTAATAIFVANLNLFAFFLIIPQKSKLITILFVTIISINFFIIHYYRSELNQILSSIYLFGV